MKSERAIFKSCQWCQNSGGVDESQDGMLAGQGLSGNKSYIYILVGVHKKQLVRDKLKNPSRQERRNALCTPSHAVLNRGRSTKYIRARKGVGSSSQFFVFP